MIRNYNFLSSSMSGGLKSKRQKNAFFMLFFMFFCAMSMNAQVTTNSGSGLAPSYATLADAVTALNGATITSPVVITQTANETAPVGGYSITAIGTSTNTITLTGAGFTLTAPNPQTTGALNDAIIKIIGGDFITIQGYVLLENAANSTTTAASNNMTEFGIALFYASATNGAQNNTIQNNTITLKRIYQNSIGIYSNTRHTATSMTVVADITNATGSNSFNKVYGNAINNVNYGTVFIGSGALTAVGAMDNGTDIGGSSAATGNTYTNWGGIGVAPSGYVSLTGNNYCIFVNNTYNDNISFNNITSASGVSGITMGGFLKNYSGGVTVQPTGTIVTTISNNTVTITNTPITITGSIIGIASAGLSPLLSTATMNITNNTIQNCVIGGTTATTAGMTCITNQSAAGTVNMTGNSVINNAITSTASTTGTLAGMANSAAAGTVNITGNVIRSMSSSAATTGQMQGIANSGLVTTAININNNQLGNATSGFFTSNVATPGVLFGIVNAAAAATCALSIQNNDFRGIVYNVAATCTNLYINMQGSSPLSHNISNNTFTNLNVNTTGSVSFISNSLTIPTGGTQTISNNSIVTGFNKGGAGGTVAGITTTGASGSATSTWNGNNFSNITVTGATAVNGISNADGTGGSINHTITNNTVSNITGGTGAISAIVSSNGGGNGGNGNVISGNSISTLTGSGIVNGISYTSGTTSNIFKNKIYDLSGTVDTSTVNGILVTGGTTNTIYNNLVGNLTTANANADNPLNGINISGTGTVNAYFNTVYLNGSSTGALFGSSAINASDLTNLTLQNNIFVNNSTVSGLGLAVAYRRSSASLTSYQAASNNNLFKSNNNIFTDGTNTDATIAAYKVRVASRDSSSFSESPNFLSTTGANANFLHIDATIATQIESGAVPVSGITDDFDGNTRNVSTPDIGADEFTGIALDLLSPSITLIPTLVNPCSLTDRTITATISDPSNVAVGGLSPRIYFRKNAGAYSSAAGTLTSGSVTTGTWTFTITYATLGGVVISDVIDYFIVAQDALGNVGGNPSTGLVLSDVNTVTTPPTTPLTYTISGFLSGTYNVGAAGVYPTLTAAINAYNTTCLGGPVVFQLLDATYSGSETFPLTINSHTDASATNTLTIRPAVGVASSISGASATSGIFKLNGADYVTIDGLNTGGSSLAISNTSATATSVVVWIGSTSASNGATNNAVKNCALTGATNTTSVAGILAGSSASFGGGAEASNSNNSIIGNTFKTTQNAIFISGAAGLDQNWVISNNTIGSTVAAEKHSFRGVFVGNAQNVTINNNTIAGVVSTTTSTATMTGIQVGGVINGGTISSNKISNIKQTNTAGWGSNGIFLAASSTTSALNVYNNFIFDVTGVGFTTANSEDNGYGIMIDSGGGYNIYYNTISMNTNQTLAGSITAAINIDVAVTTPGAINLRNNIFSNTQTVGNRYAIYNASSAGAAIFAAIDYNDYSAANVGFQAGARVTLANWQAVSLSDVNSKSVAPVFVNPASDLHLIPASNVALDNFGTPIAGITTDIDNDTRSATAPDMGADEFSNSSIVNLKFFIEGYYISATGLMRPVNLNQGVGASATDVETVTLELHNSTAPYALAVSTTAMLQTNGNAVFTFPTAPSGSFYLVVRTRNAIDTWSAVAQTVGGAPLTYDFSSDASQAFGSNMVDMNGSGTYGFYSGDIDPAHDGNIDTIDYPIWETDSNNFASGPFATDLNGDGNVDTIDYPIWENNSNNFVSVAKP